MKSKKVLLLCIILLFLVSACKLIEEKPKEKIVEFGKTVTFDYAAGFDNGTLFDTSFEIVAREAGIFNPGRLYIPERVKMGSVFLIPGLEEALLGMKEGETKNIRIPPQKAYGIKIENSTRILPKSAINNYENLKVSDIVTIVARDGNKINAYVKEIGEENVTLDINHPLAGQYVQFAVILRSIE